MKIVEFWNLGRSVNNSDERAKRHGLRYSESNKLFVRNYQRCFVLTPKKARANLWRLESFIDYYRYTAQLRSTKEPSTVTLSLYA